MDTGKSLVFDSLDDERIKGKFLMDSWPDRAIFFQSAVLVPVIVNGHSSGALGIDCPVKGAFHSDAIHLLALAADHIALLLQISDFVHGVSETPTRPLDETQSSPGANLLDERLVPEAPASEVGMSDDVPPESPAKE